MIIINVDFFIHKTDSNFQARENLLEMTVDKQARYFLKFLFCKISPAKISPDNGLTTSSIGWRFTYNCLHPNVTVVLGQFYRVIKKSLCT